MEQGGGGGFWRKQHNMNYNYLVSKNMKYSYNSWEEKAFAEDAGGCSMWPPRSYTCGFCRREFRSAQALGGHMNVHRRDRAMLSQSLLSNPNPNNNNSTTNIASSSSSSPPQPQPPSTSWSRLLGIQGSGSDHVIETTGLSVGSKRQRLDAPCFQVIGEKVGLKASLMMSSMEDLDLELRLGHDPPQVK